MDLTATQLSTLKTHIVANGDADVVAEVAAGSNSGIATLYNRDATSYVWKSSMSLEETGLLLNGEDIGNITTANAERVGIFFATQPGGVIPSRSDHRAFFDDVFSGAQGATTRANLDAAYPRLETQAEAVFSGGTGTEGTPISLVAEGALTTQNVRDAMETA